MCLSMPQKVDKTFIYALLLFIAIIIAFTVLAATTIDTFILVAYMCIFFVVQNISIMIYTRKQLRCSTEEFLQENEKQFQQIRKLHTQRCKMSDEYWIMEKKLMSEGHYWKSRCINIQIGRRQSFSSAISPTHSPNIHSMESHSQSITSTQPPIERCKSSRSEEFTTSIKPKSSEEFITSKQPKTSEHKLEMEQDVTRRSTLSRSHNSFP